MKKVLGIVVLGLLLSGNAYAGVIIDYKKKFKADLDECVKDGKWICEQSKIDTLVNKYLGEGGMLGDCEYASYKAPCICNKFEDSSLAKKKYCEFKMKPKIKKMNRMEATNHCSKLSNRQNKEVRNEYFKSCMKDKGFR